jgi:hypothetical protein
MPDAHLSEQGEGQILHPGSRQMFRHWEMLRAERPCPTREEFGLAPLAGLMPDMVIIDRDYLRNSFKFRLAGSGPCALFGHNLTGTSVTQGWDSFESDIISRHLLTAINQQQPAVLRMRLTTDMDQIVAAELVALPVQMRNSHRIHIIGGLFPFRAVQSLCHTRLVKRELVSARVVWTEHQLPMTRPEPRGYAPKAYNPGRKFSVIEGGKF